MKKQKETKTKHKHRPRSQIVIKHKRNPDHNPSQNHQWTQHNPCSQHPYARLQNFPIVFMASRPHGLHDQNLEDQPLDLLAANQYQVR